MVLSDVLYKEIILLLVSYLKWRDLFEILIKFGVFTSFIKMSFSLFNIFYPILIVKYIEYLRFYKYN